MTKFAAGFFFLHLLRRKTETVCPIISWPTLIFFEKACSLIVLDCTLRKIQRNIQVGGAKLQRTVPVYQCGYQIYCTATYSTVLSTFDRCTNLL